MSGSGSYFPNGDHRGSNRYDSYYDRSADPRDSRGRGGYRGSRGYDHYSGNYRGRGRGYGRPERHYGHRDDYRDSRDHGDSRDGTRGYRDSRGSGYRGDDSPRHGPRDPYHRDSHSRESTYSRENPGEGIRELSRDTRHDSRESSRSDSYPRNDTRAWDETNASRGPNASSFDRNDSYEQQGSLGRSESHDRNDVHFRNDTVSRNGPYTKSDQTEDRARPEPAERPRPVGPALSSEVPSRTEDRGPESDDRRYERPRPHIRGPRGSAYGPKRASDAGPGFHRGSGGSVGSVASGGITPTSGMSTPAEIPGGPRDVSKKPAAPTFTNPWISLLRLGEGKTAARLEQNHKELAAVNNKLAELQSEKIKLTCALSTLEVYAKRDALNSEICSEKLDEFTYL
ncbi:hypothetical protein OXX69_003662 [Metschnikowia pulcherrima]